jgi:hypothetical protein
MPFTIDLFGIVKEIEILQHTGDTKYREEREKRAIYLDFFFTSK